MTSTPQRPGADDERLAAIRSRGWMVAVHNDYLIGTNRLTFWLFTHPELGRFAKGEGPTDAEALAYAAHRIGEIEKEVAEIDRLRTEATEVETRFWSIVDRDVAAAAVERGQSGRSPAHSPDRRFQEEGGRRAMTDSSPSPEAIRAADRCLDSGPFLFTRTDILQMAIARALDEFAGRAIERKVSALRSNNVLDAASAAITELCEIEAETNDRLAALAVQWGRDAMEQFEFGKKRAAEAVISGTAPQSGWRPIETAPKDGTYILLGAPSGYSTTPMRAHVGRWGTTYKVDRWIIHSNDDFTDDGCPPTHWMPLPLPPTEDATG